MFLSIQIKISKAEITNFVTFFNKQQRDSIKKIVVINKTRWFQANLICFEFPKKNPYCLKIFNKYSRQNEKLETMLQNEFQISRDLLQTSYL